MSSSACGRTWVSLSLSHLTTKAKAKPHFCQILNFFNVLWHHRILCFSEEKHFSHQNSLLHCILEENNKIFADRDQKYKDMRRAESLREQRSYTSQMDNLIMWLQNIHQAKYKHFMCRNVGRSCYSKKPRQQMYHGDNQLKGSYL